MGHSPHPAGEEAAAPRGQQRRSGRTGLMVRGGDAAPTASPQPSSNSSEVGHSRFRSLAAAAKDLGTVRRAGS